VCFDVPGPQPDRVFVGAYGIFPAVQIPEQISSPEMRLRNRGVELDSLITGRQGIVKLFALEQGEGVIEVVGWITGLAADSPGDMLHGLLVLTLLTGNQAQQVVGVCLFGVRIEDCPGECLCIVQLAPAEMRGSPLKQYMNVGFAFVSFISHCI